MIVRLSSLPRIAVMLVFAAGRACAQDGFRMPAADDPPPPAVAEAPRGASDAARPLDDLLGDLVARAEPHLQDLARDLGGLAEDYAPLFDELGGLVDDIGNYQRPERLPNGDVLIRRKPGAPPAPAAGQLEQLVPGVRPKPPAPPPPAIPPAAGGTDFSL